MYVVCVFGGELCCTCGCVVCSRLLSVLGGCVSFVYGRVRRVLVGWLVIFKKGGVYFGCWCLMSICLDLCWLWLGVLFVVLCVFVGLVLLSGVGRGLLVALVYLSASLVFQMSRR